MTDDALLFANLDGTPFSSNAISSAWAIEARHMKVPEVTFHALRHTHASQLIDGGVDIVTISRKPGTPSQISPCASAVICFQRTIARRRRRSMRRWCQLGANFIFCSFAGCDKPLQNLAGRVAEWMRCVSIACAVW